MLQFFGILSGLFAISASIPYIRDILKGTTKPERASWLIWATLGSIAFFAQLSSGASDSLWMTGMQTLEVCVTFALALKFGVGGLMRRDVLALACAGVGLLVWYFTDNAAVALFIVIVIDAVGAALTIRKAYECPDSETFSAWVLAGISGMLACFAVGRLDFILLAYPVYILVINLAVCGAMIAGGWRAPAAEPAEAGALPD